ncbi:unnamed protein product, partial [Brassica oleracea]
VSYLIICNRQYIVQAKVSRKYHHLAKTLIHVAGLIEGYNPNCWKYSGSRFDNVKKKKIFYLSLYLQSKIIIPMIYPVLICVHLK